MNATRTVGIGRQTSPGQPVSSPLRGMLAALRRPLAGPVLWLGMPLLALLPLLLE